MVIAIPSGITAVEKRAVTDSAMSAGARKVITIPEPMAAAIGVGLPIDEPAANMIVDIGGGTTEIAIISLNGIVFSKSIRVAGDELDSAIINYMKRAYNLLIGERTAEEIKMRVGSAYPLDEELTMEVKGRDSVAGLPKTIHITSQEVREALADTIAAIVDAVRTTLERCPPELSADLVDRGFVMAGGGSLIRGIDRLLSEKTGLPVTVADDPLSAVANGTGAVLKRPLLAHAERVRTGGKRFDQERPFLTLGIVLAVWLILPVGLKYFSRATFFEATAPLCRFRLLRARPPGVLESEDALQG